MDKEESFPSEFQKRTLWRAVTGVAIVIIGALLAGFIWLSSNVLGYLQPVLVPLAVAGIIAYLLEPVVRWLQTKGFTRMKGIIAVFTGFLLFFGILFSFVCFKISNLQTQSEDAPTSSEKRFVNAKSNKFYGWIARDFLTKDQAKVTRHLEAGKTITPPDEALLQKYETSVEDLTSIIDSPWSTAPLAAPVEPAKDADAAAQAAYQADLAKYQKNQQLVEIESSLAQENFWLTKAGSKLISFSTSAQTWLFNSYGKILGIFGVFIGFAMVPIYLYYFLKESDSIQSGWQDYVPLKASKFKTEVVETLREINGYLISFFRGQVLVAFIDGILVGIALSIYQLQYGLLIGVVMALLGIIPYLGNIICLIPACLIAYFQKDIPYGLSEFHFALGVVIIFVVVQQINSLLTAPKIVGDSVGLHPMTVIFSMLFWSLLLGGFLGALLAVPLTAAVKVIFRRYVWERKKDQYILNGDVEEPEEELEESPA